MVFSLTPAAYAETRQRLGLGPDVPYPSLATEAPDSLEPVTADGASLAAKRAAVVLQVE